MAYHFCYRNYFLHISPPHVGIRCFSMCLAHLTLVHSPLIVFPFGSYGSEVAQSVAAHSENKAGQPRILLMGLRRYAPARAAFRRLQLTQRVLCACRAVPCVVCAQER